MTSLTQKFYCLYWTLIRASQQTKQVILIDFWVKTQNLFLCAHSGLALLKPEQTAMSLTPLDQTRAGKIPTMQLWRDFQGKQNFHLLATESGVMCTTRNLHYDLIVFQHLYIFYRRELESKCAQTNKITKSY